MSPLIIIAPPHYRATARVAAILPMAQVMTTMPASGRVVLLTSYAEDDVEWTAKILPAEAAVNILLVVQTDADFPFLATLRRRAQQAWANRPLVEWSNIDDDHTARNLAMAVAQYFARADNHQSAHKTPPQQAVLQARQALADIL